MEVEYVNMKNLFPDDKTTKEKILDFFSKKGFYIVLVVCICILGAAAVFITTNNLLSPKNESNPDVLISEDDQTDQTSYIDETEMAPAMESSVNTSPALKTKEQDIKETEDKTQGKKDANQAPTKEPANTKEPEKTEPVKEEPKKTDVKQVAPKAQNDVPAGLFNKTEQKFVMPVLGEITFDYALDRLVYSKTLEEWRTHSGVDIAAQRGTAVKATADGVVTEIKSDPRFGITVVIDHGNGIKTVYSNLASQDGVSPNQKVKQGEAIGSVGNTAIFESAEESHLHFEVLKDDKLVDPKDYLPAK